ncbi:MAG: sigma-70 family RNA polymerase sigma factor [Pseudomonas sp.]|nr:sigma-70 family RNA polymerase sigma factor [Pseudomonas sp.]
MTPQCILSAWHAHEHELRAFLLARIDNPHEAEDLLHELFLKLARQEHAFCQVENPRAWLFRVLRNSLIDRLRTAKTFLDLNPEMPFERDEKPPVTELDTCLQRNLAELGDEDKNIIEHCDLQGQTQRNYAQQHNLTLSAVKSRLLRARMRLRHKIVINCQVEFDESGHVCCHTPR